MKTYKHILALDPSGNWTEGKGTTGICYLQPHNKKIEVYSISAKAYTSPEGYWNTHVDYLEAYHRRYGEDLVVVIEDYLLYGNKAQSQINSHMETPKLIGVLQHYCYTHAIPCYMEPASTVKSRWTNPILERKGYIQATGNCYSVNGKKISRHCLDAIRHAVHYATFVNGKKEKII